MKVISLWQPWATLMAVGLKRTETRHWPIKYRGPLAIHAARSTEGRPDFEGRLYQYLPGYPRWQDLPFGAIVAVGRLTKCSRSEDIVAAYEAEDCPAAAKGQWLIEQELGNFGPRRYGWLLQDVQRLAVPIECTGRQGLFDVPDSVFPPEVLAAIIKPEGPAVTGPDQQED